MTKSEAYNDLFVLFTGKPPPFPIPEVDRLGVIPDDKYSQLQEFVLTHSKLPWLTGIGVLEAMDALVYESIARSEKDFERAKPTFPR
jgi:hypothetical protein